MNWISFWAQLREPLTQIPYLGESGPWVLLVAVVLLCELLIDFWISPWMERKGMTGLAKKVTADGNNLRSGVFVAVFAGGTTLQTEAAVLAVIAGGVTIGLRRWKELRAYLESQLMGPLGALLLALNLWGCGAREACYARNDAAFNEVVDQCHEDGLSYDDCPAIKAAERRQEEADRRCP